MSEEYYPDREDNYYRKSDLLSRLESIASQNYSTFKEWIDTKDEVREIIDDWKSTGSVNCREARRYHDNPGEYLSDGFKSALDDYYAEGDRLRQERDDEFSDREASKEAIIDEARDLLDLDNPFEAQRQYRELRDRWNDIGFCGQSNDALWDSFRDLGDEIKQRAANRVDEFAQALARKRQIVDELHDVLEDAPPGARMPLVRQAEADWRDAGSGGKNENEIWKEFQALVQPIKVAAREHAAKMSDRANAKRALIAEANALQRENRDRWRQYQEILVKWKAVGSAGRAENDLWSEFKSIGDALRLSR